MPSVYSVFALIASVVLFAFTSPATQAQSQQQLMESVRFGSEPHKTRLVFEGSGAFNARVMAKSSATDIHLRLTLPDTKSVQDWLPRIVPKRHQAIKSVNYHVVNSTTAELHLEFNAPTLVDTFYLKSMEGFLPRLVIDFHTASEALEELWVDVTLNRKNGFGTVLALAFKNDDILIAGPDLSAWRVTLPERPYLEHYATNYYSLRNLGVEFKLNRALMQLAIEIPATQFAEIKLQGHQRSPIKLAPSSPGFYLNYDLTATENNLQTTGAGFLELGAFNRWGNLNHTSVHRYNNDTSSVESIRLNTVWRTDFPERMTSLYIGDMLTGSAGWNRNIRLAGIKWATNFSTQPELIKVPTLAFTGLATEPSTVDLYINDALRFRRTIPTGPFSIDDLPTITGYGDVQMVITDLLGRQRVSSQNYFTDRHALRAGLHDYSYALGSIRNNYGLTDADYNGWLANAYHRYGVSNAFTAEFSARVGEDYQLIGAGGIQVLPWNNSMTFSVAGNHHSDGEGQLIQLGLQHQRRNFNFGIEAQKSLNDFRISPNEQVIPYPEFQLTSYFSWSSLDFGSMRLAYTEQRQNNMDIAFVNASLSKHLGAFGHLSFNALQFLTEDEDFQISVSLNIPFGEQSNFSTGATHYSSRDTGYAQVLRQAPVGTGFGYRLRQGLLDESRSQADLKLNTAVGNYEASYYGNDRVDAYRASARGSLSFVGGYFSFGQPVRDSFALVHLPNFADVRVYAENQHVATTDAEGFAFIPRLRAYQRNRIRLDATDLPLSANIESLTQEVSPYYRSGVVIEFPVSSLHSVMMNVIDSDGAFIPVGAEAYIDERPEPVHLGYDGLLYLTSVKAAHQVTIRYEQDGERQECGIRLVVPESENSLQDLGNIACE